MLSGKGLYVHYLSRLGTPVQIAEQAKSAGLTHLIIKVADGRTYYNRWKKLTDGREIHNATDGLDLVPPVVAELKRHGIQAWGFQYIYGSNPLDEAQTAIRRCTELGLDGFVVNAEKEFKGGYAFPAKESASRAKTYGSALWLGLHGRLPIAFSSYRYPDLHRPLPFEVFLEYCDFNMPQVYWAGTQSPQSPHYQLVKSITQYERLSVKRPIFPTGAAYKEWGWQPTIEQIQGFMEACKELGLKGCNFWEFYYARDMVPGAWQTISNFDFGVLPEPTDKEKLDILWEQYKKTHP